MHSFREELKKKIEQLFSKTNNRYSYSIANDIFLFHYWSKALKEICHPPFQHLDLGLSIGNNAVFNIFIMPSSALGNSTCMAVLRKKFIDSIYIEKRIDISSQDTKYMHTECVPDHFYFVDITKRYAFYVINDFKNARPISLSYYVSPFQYLFQFILHQLNKQMTHIAAIANDTFGILLSGASGAGKTTTTLSAIQQGYYYIGEDYTVLEKKEQLFAHSIYNTVKMTETTYERINDFSQQRFISIPLRKKNAYFMAEHDRFKIKLSSPIRAICSLSVSRNTKAVLVRQTPRQAIKSFAFSTIMHNPIFANETLKKFCSFLDSDLELYHLTLGTDAESNLEQINKIFLDHAT